MTVSLHPGDRFQYHTEPLDTGMCHSTIGAVGLWAESALHGGHAEMDTAPRSGSPLCSGLLGSGVPL